MRQTYSRNVRDQILCLKYLQESSLLMLLSLVDSGHSWFRRVLGAIGHEGGTNPYGHGLLLLVGFVYWGRRPLQSSFVSIKCHFHNYHFSTMPTSCSQPYNLLSFLLRSFNTNSSQPVPLISLQWSKRVE